MSPTKVVPQIPSMSVAEQSAQIRTAKRELRMYFSDVFKVGKLADIRIGLLSGHESGVEARANVEYLGLHAGQEFEVSARVTNRGLIRQAMLWTKDSGTSRNGVEVKSLVELAHLLSASPKGRS